MTAMPENYETHGSAATASFEVGLFRPEDAEGIVNLFRAVYGESYPIKIFYDPKALTEVNNKGEYYSIVVREASGKVVGVTHLYQSAPYKRSYEIGAGLVLSKYRGLGLNKSMFHFIFEQWIPCNEAIEEIFGEPVCNHTIIQKETLKFNVVETALEVALMPAQAYSKETSASGRVATILAFRCYRSRPHKVFLPSRYKDELHYIYVGLDDARQILEAKDRLPAEVSSRAEMTVFDFAHVARIAVHETGSDFSAYIDDLEKKALDKGVVVIQVWLKLSRTSVGAEIEILRDKGYFLGGVLPRWFDDDGLLMQKVICNPEFETIQVYSDRAKTILDMIKNDWWHTR